MINFFYHFVPAEAMNIFFIVVPVNKNIKMLVTSDPTGVIHSWAMPSFGVKMDAIPGRLNET